MKQLNKFLLSMLVLLTTSLTAFAEENITFYHYDLLGSPVATTNEMGEVVWKESYGAWGEKLLNEDATEDNVRGYTGHVNDTETGLTYMQARYYDPQIGRFMGIDPVGFKEDNPIMFNRYAYANNNPYKYVDPNGEEPNVGDSLEGMLDAAVEVMNDVLDNLHNKDDDYRSKYDLTPAPAPQINFSANYRDEDWGQFSKTVSLAVIGVVSRRGASPTDNEVLGHSVDKQALVAMAKKDKKTGISNKDLDAYKELNEGLKDPFPSNLVRGPEKHEDRNYKDLHGHVGPVHHIPIIK